MEQKVEDLKAAIANNKEEIEDMKVSLRHSLLEVQALRMTNAELTKVQWNWIPSGERRTWSLVVLTKKKRENTWECLASIVEQKMEIKDAKSFRIQRCHRLERKKERHSNPQKTNAPKTETLVRPRQVIIRFLCHQDRMKVWSSLHKLKGTNISTNEDFPKATQTARRVLIPHLKVALSKDKTSSICMDKLVIKVRAYDAHQIQRDILYS